MRSGLSTSGDEGAPGGGTNLAFYSNARHKGALNGLWNVDLLPFVAADSERVFVVVVWSSF